MYTGATSDPPSDLYQRTKEGAANGTLRAPPRTVTAASQSNAKTSNRAGNAAAAATANGAALGGAAHTERSLLAKILWKVSFYEYHTWPCESLHG